MTYQLDSNGTIFLHREDGSVRVLPPENNGTPAWAEYQVWLDDGNTPEPVPPPPAPVELTPAEKLAAAGLTVEELKALFSS